MRKQDLLSLFELKDPFEDFSPLQDSRLWGWNGNRLALQALVNLTKPKIIIEVGSWMGLSSANFSLSMKQLGLHESTLICIDTWLGSLEHWIEPENRSHLELQNGYPTFYQRFLSNMAKADCADNLIPLPMPSQIAHRYLSHYNIASELIYVDGSHDEKDVYEDLISYWELLTPGGVIFGDDWPWESVANAVQRFCRDKGVNYGLEEINWYIPKPHVQQEGVALR